MQHLRCGREIPARLVTKDEIDYRTEPAHQRLAQKCLDWDQRENAAKFSKNPPNADPFRAEVLIEDLLCKSGPAHLQCIRPHCRQVTHSKIPASKQIQVLSCLQADSLRTCLQAGFIIDLPAGWFYIRPDILYIMC